MLAYIRGKIISKTENSAIIETRGLGYEVFFSLHSLSLLGPEGSDAEAYLIESLSQYAGTTLYGFLTVQEKQLFETLKDNVKDTGPKKALDFLTKISKAPQEFYRCVEEKDAKRMHLALGFTIKTAEKLIASLKDKLPELAGQAKQPLRPSSYTEAMNALVSLGYRTMEARNALEEAYNETGPGAKTADLIRLSLKKMAKR